MKKIPAILLALLLLLSIAAAEVIGGADGPTAIFIAPEAAPGTTPEANEAGGAPDGPTSIYIAPGAEVTEREILQIIGAVASAEVSVTPEPTQAPRLAGLVIGIDPGHQGSANYDQESVAPGSSETKAKVSSGTSGVRTGIDEYVTDLEISLKLRDLLVSQGCTVYMTRESHDVDISNKERAELMNSLGVDLVLRIHCDGAEDSSANGIGMFVRETGEKQAESQAAAEILLDAMTEATGARRRSVYLRDTYTMNNWSVVPCILVECGFMSNPEEDEKLNDPAYQDLLVQGMAEGIARYFER